MLCLMFIHTPPLLCFFPSVFSLFAWTSIVDLILAMQADGLIANFIDFYLIEVINSFIPY